MPKGRQTWCSQACVDTFLGQTPAGFRAAVLERAAGRCAVCRLDVNALEKRIARIKKRQQRLRRRRDGWLSGWPRPKSRWSPSWLFEWFRRRGLNITQSILEADHIVPLVEGGALGPENGRALCQRCHKVATAQLAARRARQRRG